MNSVSTNIFNFIIEKFPITIEYLVQKQNLKLDKELKLFLHYNAHNEMYTDITNYKIHHIFKNLNNGHKSKLFTDKGAICFLPEDKDTISADNKRTAFMINKNTKSIKINDNGLFIEANDLNGNIITLYYDIAALNEIYKHNLSFENITSIEKDIQKIGIYPDRIISANKRNDNLLVTITENGKIIKEEEIKKIRHATPYYLTYYEYMKLNGYYEDSVMHKNNLNR